MMKQYHSITILPNGVDGVVHTIQFDSMEEKMSYVSSEWKYCKKAYDEWNSTDGEIDRKKARNALMKKRVEFAKKQHFAPTKSNKTLWVRDPSKVPSPNNNDDGGPTIHVA